MQFRGNAAREAARTLRAAKRLGSVVVVTNAEWGWVELSCKKFIPTLLPLLEGIKIRSARSAYEPLGKSPVMWKRRAFNDELRNFCQEAELSCPPRRLANVVSLGDSIHEREALLSATQDITDCWGKSVKFIQRPDMKLFGREHRFLSTCLRPIIKHRGKLDLCLRFDN